MNQQELDLAWDTLEEKPVPSVDDLFDALENGDTTRDPNWAALAFNAQRNALTRNQEQFRKTFGISLRPFYGDNALEMILGFDVIKFDDYLIRKHFGGVMPDGESMSDYITRLYGEEANWLIKRLIQV